MERHTQAAVFTAAATATAIALAFLTLENVLAAAPPNLKNPFLVFAAFLFSVGVTAVVGALAGFHFLRRRLLLTSRTAALGAAFGVAAFFLFFPVLDGAGVYAGAAIYAALAAFIAFAGGRIWSRATNAPAATRERSATKR